MYLFFKIDYFADTNYIELKIRVVLFYFVSFWTTKKASFFSLECYVNRYSLGENKGLGGQIVKFFGPFNLCQCTLENFARCMLFTNVQTNKVLLRCL